MGAILQTPELILGSSWASLTFAGLNPMVTLSFALLVVIMPEFTGNESL